MYLWRNLPEGQLLAVLRWFQARREARRAVADAQGVDEQSRPVEPAPRALR